MIGYNNNKDEDFAIMRTQFDLKNKLYEITMIRQTLTENEHINSIMAIPF